MERIKKLFLVIAAMALMLSTGVAAQAQDANNMNTQDQFNASLSQSLYYDKDTGKVQIDENRMAELQSISFQEAQALKEINEALSNLSKEETDKKLIEAGYDPEKLEDGEYLPNAFPVFLVGIGLILLYLWYDSYITYKEKTDLINACTRQGGYPKMDKRDISGYWGSPDAGYGFSIGGYNFACMKNPQD
ncbi:hypothetical protein NCCP2222_29780 [Sporosarcina sp. NCCP-2222]|uniref:hypothetical protein n=1 Tax=Sporosarcina sp. NCCP-2222 TaxID=2935073 RepID=UPI00208BCDBF|nr:hypothetical protein [Sporosarcina sp. NCCP-2222]GKV57031.1 hypothetical protein NCCP2222_29780 [Sporosarcina sp. NCCP-2222]